MHTYMYVYTTPALPSHATPAFGAFLSFPQSRALSLSLSLSLCVCVCACVRVCVCWCSPTKISVGFPPSRGCHERQIVSAAN